ncbi:hypothetical protein [Caulobacter hibisci]|uniref:HTH iclR-type domain-containing protein n=1 Tax=Caulobacter hibisci TaxID=2035993 RepID=A0ABS0SV01_9CAUL|nr:hypothetical protein [Caulobacter hibisci]MBI1683234.1 hypothetical protein [Caulobacter hibisci]
MSTDVRRAVIRLSAGYFLRSLDVAKSVHGNDPVRAVVFTTIWVANTSHIKPNMGFDAKEALVQDALRRPVTVVQIADSLAMPAETVRRHVSALIADGLCVRHGRKGVTIPAEVFTRPEMLACLDRQHQYTETYYRELQRLVSA